jgi:DNA-binding ferritin-like protein (Dps family)
MTMFSKFISKVVGEKGQWRENKARARQLPASYRTALDALERYLNYLGPGGDGGAIYADLIDLFEQSAANGTPIREIVGEDPVEFIDAFVQNYPEGHWRTRERERFINAVERAADEDAGKDERTI